MHKKLKISLRHEASHAVARAKVAASKNGVDLNGDESAGTFSGRGIEGAYAVSGSVISITINRKPALVPWGMIEQRLKDFFADPA